jgi:hypothetical protein
MTVKVKEMKTSQIYRADSVPQAPKSALRGLMQLLGLTLLACSAVSASAQSAKDVKGSTPLVAIQNEPPVKLIVDPPIPEQSGEPAHSSSVRKSCA